MILLWLKTELYTWLKRNTEMWLNLIVLNLNFKYRYDLMTCFMLPVHMVLSTVQTQTLLVSPTEWAQTQGPD